MNSDSFKSAPWFDFYPERFIAGTAIMELSERGAYITLLCHQWLAGSLPEDPRILARLAGGDVAPAVLDKFPVCDDGKRRNAKLESVRVEQMSRMLKSKEKAQKAASARWSNHAPSNAQAMHKHTPSISSEDAGAMLDECLPHPSSLIPHPNTQKPQPREKIKRPTVGPEPEACAVVLPGKPSAELQDCWNEWQQYRQKRASAPFAKDRKPWTEQAARLSAKQIMQYAASHGDRIICDRITKAIASGWQGPNFDGLDGPSAYPRKMTYEQELELHTPNPNSENGW